MHLYRHLLLDNARFLTNIAVQQNRFKVYFHSTRSTVEYKNPWLSFNKNILQVSIGYQLIQLVMHNLLYTSSYLLRAF
jgi:hypothetical protein